MKSRDVPRKPTNPEEISMNSSIKVASCMGSSLKGSGFKVINEESSQKYTPVKSEQFSISQIEMEAIKSIEKLRQGGSAKSSRNQYHLKARSQTKVESPQIEFEESPIKNEKKELDRGCSIDLLRLGGDLQ